MTYIGDHQRIEPAARPGLTPAAVAGVMLDGFNRHYSLFRYGAQRAKALFESGDWHGIQQLSRERIEYYDTRVRECTTTLNSVRKNYFCCRKRQGRGFSVEMGSESRPGR